MSTSARMDGRIGAAPGVLREHLQRIATGPEQSKDLSHEEARRGMALILSGEADPVEAGVFLIALRMKRETDDENRGVLDAIRAVTRSAAADVDDLLDLSDPYDGYLRSLPPSPFLPALLAACALPAVSHGLECVGPKLGVTHRQVLAAAGAPVDLDPVAAAARVADARVGWAYVDQRAACPALHALVDLRRLIVKRPVITTVEGLAGPLRARGRTHLLRGYVHKAYPRVYLDLARHAGFDSALVLRGAEGGVIPSLRQPGHGARYRGAGADQPVRFDPGALGVERDTRAVPVPAGLLPGGDARAAPDARARAGIARAAAEAGLAALEGARGATADALVYAAALALWHAGRCPDPQAGAARARAALAAGEALARFRAAADAG